jgi:hypothetical protein
VNIPMPEIKLRGRFWNAVHFEFELGQRVVIRGSSIEADVVALIKDQDAEQYRIVYWYNGTRFDVWVFSREIIAKSQDSKPASLPPAQLDEAPFKRG